MVSDDQLIPWERLQQRRDELEQQLAARQLDQKKRVDLQREYAFLQDVLSKKQAIDRINHEITRAQQQRAHADPQLQALYDEELKEFVQQKSVFERELEELLYPPDPMDRSDVFIEIRAGAGGQEAALFAGDLAKMYLNYSLSRGWHAVVVDAHETDLRGYKEIVLEVDGKGAYGAFKFEAGTHRVQRVPATEASGRIHTSTATVAVFPVVGDDQSITINPQDLRVDTYRSGGAGGQHVNKTESAVRITHIPTGVVVSCQEERSQHKNRAKAMKMLMSRLAAAKREEEAAKRSQDRKQMVGSGMRAEKVRTYNFPQNRVTDHQVGLTLQKLDRVIAGDMSEIIQALQDHERQERRSQKFSF